MVSNSKRAVAVVLAGGFGTRIRHLLHEVPKPMAPVAGKPFLDWVLLYLARQGVSSAVLSTGYLADVIERRFADGQVGGVSTQCVRETEPLGTAGGFVNAARASGQTLESWLVLNGDSLALADLAPAFEELNDPQTVGVLIGCSVADAARYGTLSVGADGRLLGFHEKRPGKGVINAGIYLFRSSMLERFPVERPLSFEKDVFPRWIQEGLVVKVVTVSAPFLDIGTPESLAQAEAFIRNNMSHFAS